MSFIYLLNFSLVKLILQRMTAFVFCFPTDLCFPHCETGSEKDLTGDGSRDPPGHRKPLSTVKLAALCTEVWPVFAVIGGVDSGLRAGGLCLHKPSARRAILLGVLKEGSYLAKLQWEEADLSFRYHKTHTFTYDQNTFSNDSYVIAHSLPLNNSYIFLS